MTCEFDDCDCDATEHRGDWRLCAKHAVDYDTLWDQKLRLHVWSEGDASVGMGGQYAEVTFERPAAVSPRELAQIKAALKQAFEQIWDDDVHVLTQQETDEDSQWDSAD